MENKEEIVYKEVYLINCQKEKEKPLSFETYLKFMPRELIENVYISMIRSELNG